MPITEEQRLAKNERIREAGAATRSRHAKMRARTFEVKIITKKLKASQKEAIDRQMLESKWLRNACISYLNDNPDKSPNDFTKEHGLSFAEVKLPDGSIEQRELTTLSAQGRQSVIAQVVHNLMSLATLKRNSHEVGKLKFKGQPQPIELIQYGISYSIKSAHKVKVARVPGHLYVRGLEQIPKDAEISSARLIKKPSGYYLKITCYVQSDLIVPIEEVKTVIGIDMGLKHTAVISDRRTYEATIEEPERLKALQGKLAKQKLNSNNRRKTRNLLEREYERMKNKKENLANQIAHEILESADRVIIQDESLKAWHRKFGRSVQHGVLGRLKARLVASPKVIVLNKWVATTKTCVCREKLDLTLADREINCPHCGYRNDRDLHAAQNMLIFAHDKANIKIGQELSEFTPVENGAAVVGSLGFDDKHVR